LGAASIRRSKAVIRISSEFKTSSKRIGAVVTHRAQSSPIIEKDCAATGADRLRDTPPSDSVMVV
jgi:hypothetical protein